MPIIFTNDYSKKFHARKGPPKIFGRDVDDREKLSDPDAIARFDAVWTRLLEAAVRDAEKCDVDFVRSKVSDKVAARISANAEHREFMLANCFFICQLPKPTTCDELWFIPSASGDPRLLYVNFENVPIREAFDEMARNLGWEKPEELGEKVLLDFMESVTRKTYRTESQVQRWKLQEGLEDAEE